MRDIELDTEEAEEKKEKANATLLFTSSLDKESTFYIYIWYKRENVMLLIMRNNVRMYHVFFLI